MIGGTSIESTAALIGLLVAAIVGAGGIAATVWAVGKVKGLELTVDVLGKGNEALRAELEDRDRRHGAELAALSALYATNERAATERIARLEGHNAVLIDGIADRIAESIAKRLELALRSLGDRIVTTPITAVVGGRRETDPAAHAAAGTTTVTTTTL